MKRRILMSLALFALSAAVSAGLLQAQGLTEAERPPYRIDLQAGWNLISFPGDPVDPALENVVGESQVDMVLAYESGQWSAAVRNAEGGWRTTSGFTTMSGVRGYWVHSSASETIDVTLTSSDARPTLETIAGWNLVGIWDAEQRRAGTPIDPESYFNAVNWRVAYTFDSAANLWKKIIPNSNKTIETGAGFWVWTSSPGCLCP